MLSALRDFLAVKDLTKAEASATLRLVFASMFLAQVSVALLVGFGLRLSFDSRPGSSLLAQILLGFSLLQLPITLFLTQQAGRSGGRQAALSATLLSGVLLATPAWFLSLALALGTESLYLMIFFAVLMSYYLVGLVLTRGATKAALQPERKPESWRSTQPKALEDS